ncbi:hypothetical protein D3870_02460 [Noviherbaspirillum cavernae]|uniref:Uncharacterized protein n=1 Tax=Noviherbaspirillum cavernae TaxID=2320862 RepID=A0A418WXQ7_9BURK|nr:hypothetical protein [Noviherbaspirillum cavernae]RJG05028.1 hypothetical protein D3870_02460 [Noviherbaspirillum cavernae]
MIEGEFAATYTAHVWRDRCHGFHGAVEIPAASDALSNDKEQRAFQLAPEKRGKAGIRQRGRFLAVAIDRLVEEAIQHFEQEADWKTIDIGFELQPTQVMGDRFLLRDLIDKLFDSTVSTLLPCCIRRESAPAC